MRKLFLVLMAFVCLAGSASAQDTTAFYISILDPAFVPTTSLSGGQLTIHFAQEGANSIVSKYTLIGFQKAYPSSRYQHLQQVYLVTANSMALGHELVSAYPAAFAGVQPFLQSYPLTLPNDYGKAFNNTQEDLTLIDAEHAWGITTGSPNTIIGMCDQRLYRAHPDLTGKCVGTYTYGPNNNFYLAHGNIVAGVLAAHTNNDTGLAAIGYNCRIEDYSALDSSMLLLSSTGIRVINGSFYDNTQNILNFSGYTEQVSLYDEIYENGTTVVCGAGNGNMPGFGNPCGNTTCYFFPASYDHNISVSSVGHLNDPVYPYNSLTDSNVKDYFNLLTASGIVRTMNHNDRVDICAPGYNIKSHDYNFGNIPVTLYNVFSGTSLSSPMVAGTVALMQTKTPCLSPYQIEYILKKTARNLDTIAANAPYVGEMGAGRLNSYQALKFIVDSPNVCNKVNLQTMYISGIGVNTICAPGFNTANSRLPQLKPMVVNGTPPYTYRWLAMPGNTTALSDSSIGAPFITTSTGTRIAWYYLTVTDASPIAPKVASHVVKIRLDTIGYDLAMRDSYFDMLDEPNAQATVDPRDWQLWESPDIWNRLKADDSTSPQNPEFFTQTNNDYLYVRIRNVGCAASPATGAKVHLYWTKQSTGEQWSRDWKYRNDTLTTFINGLPTTYYEPAGREITDTVNGIAIPQMNPGDTFLTNHIWHPVDPTKYRNSPTSVEVCALARIETAAGPGFGMHTPEHFTGTVTYNVLQNNNIVTRNMILANLGRAHAKFSVHPEIRNPDAATQIFSLQLLSDKDIHRHYAGNISDYLYATVSLGALFDRWVDGGSKGVTGTVDETAKTITYDPSTPLRLDNISLDSGENFPITITFQLRDSAIIDYPVSTHVHLRQLIGSDKEATVYGNVSYAINIEADSQADQKRQAPAALTASAPSLFTAYPNPNDGLLHIGYQGKDRTTVEISMTDIAGRTVIGKRNVVMSNGQNIILNTSSLRAGIYFVHITSTDGTNETIKITKME